MKTLQSWNGLSWALIPVIISLFSVIISNFDFPYEVFAAEGGGQAQGTSGNVEGGGSDGDDSSGSDGDDSSGSDGDDSSGSDGDDSSGSDGDDSSGSDGDDGSDPNDNKFQLTEEQIAGELNSLTPQEILEYPLTDLTAGEIKSVFGYLSSGELARILLSIPEPSIIELRNIVTPTTFNEIIGRLSEPDRTQIENRLSSSSIA